MLSRLSLLLALTALVALTAVPASSAGQRKGKPCAAKGSQTVAKNRFARVYETNPDGADVTARLYACLYSNDRRLVLDESSGDEYYGESYEQVKLNGRFVGWQHISSDESCKADCPPGYDPTTETVSVASLATRKVRSASGAVEAPSLRVTAKGTAAWVESATGDGYVVRMMRGKTVTTIDAGDIPARSLELAGGRLTWTNGGTPRSAPIR